MSDLDDISALVHSYARLLDGGDIDAVVALFEHSTWRSLPNGSTLRGAEVRPVYEQLMARQGGDRTKHLITNLNIDVDANGMTARAHCYWTVLHAGPGQPVTINLSGQYADRFVKADQRWRFADRLITVDLHGAGTES
jgi:3-phenylpropionate/cinnamic acid dioxygenase small subunit